MKERDSVFEGQKICDYTNRRGCLALVQGDVNLRISITKKKEKTKKETQTRSRKIVYRVR